MAKRPRRSGLSSQPHSCLATGTSSFSSIKWKHRLCHALPSRITVRLKWNNICEKPVESVRQGWSVRNHKPKSVLSLYRIKFVSSEHWTQVKTEGLGGFIKKWCALKTKNLNNPMYINSRMNKEVVIQQKTHYKKNECTLKEHPWFIYTTL